MARNSSTPTAVASAPATEETKVPRKRGEDFKITNKTLGELNVKAPVPAVTDEILNSYFGTGEDADKAKNEALKKFVHGERVRAVANYFRDAEKMEDVTADKALAVLSDLKFSARGKRAGVARKVTRSTADLSAAVAALGGMPKNNDELLALLAKLNVAVEAPTTPTA